MTYLFFARHFTYFRNFESVICTLAEHGHHVHLAAEKDEEYGGRQMIDRLAERYPGLVTPGWAPDRVDGWYRLATKLRLTLGYLRYLEPEHESTPHLRTRAERRVPRLLLAALRLPFFGGAAGRLRFARILSRLERAIPCDPALVRYIEGVKPDAVLITPLVGIVASPQPDYLQAARSLGIPTALCVWSWDHLSSKAVIRTLPDRVFVWNPTQRQEAIELHNVPEDRVIVTGAQCFDQWFDREPSRDRASFCRRVGLRDDGPYLLWVCSALFRGTVEEAPFVARWVRTLRESGHQSLRDVNILIRPHPSRLKEWENIDISQWDGVAFWGGNPIDTETREDYFDSLYHSAAVAGLNTSAFIEAGIVGRPVYTVLLPELRENQEGTIHFHYLLNIGGGLLNASRTLDDHAAQLDDLLTGRAPDPDRSRRFVEAFVRPHGLTRAATPLFADAVEALGRSRTPPRRRARRGPREGRPLHGVDSVGADLQVGPAGDLQVGRVPLSLRLLASFERGIGHAVMMDARERREVVRSRRMARLEAHDRRTRLAAKADQRAVKARRAEQRERGKQQIEAGRKRRKFMKTLRARFGLG